MFLLKAILAFVLVYYGHPYIGVTLALLTITVDGKQVG
jgi:hypothetical protein